MALGQEDGILGLQKRLYGKFSSSQTYFYTNKINQIIKEKRTEANIFYEDIEYLLDTEENLKRWYQGKEFDNKMFTFKEYYFYHEDCPRIFMKQIEEPYAKWQDKKRDLVYKKLKLLYKESYSSDLDSRLDDQKSQNYVATTHFLLEISDYNPFSKKYYLRVEARKEKEKQRLEEEKKNQSRRDLESLNHELSAMLEDMSMLSEISTISKNNPTKDKERLKPKARNTFKDSLDDKSKSNSTNLSNSNSIITFNFKKNKGSSDKLKSLKDPKKFILRDRSKEKEIVMPQAGRISPKFNSSPGEIPFLKSKSIFSVSSFGALNKNTDFQTTMNKKDPLKLNFEIKKLTIDDNRKYSTEKKKDSLPKNIVIKTKSTSKFEGRGSVDKIRSREGSVGRLPRADEFSDKKLAFNGHFEPRLRSLKSELVGGGQKSRMNPRQTLELKLGPSNPDRNKRLLELKRY